MPNDTNLALNIDTVGSAERPRDAARVAVTSISGYLRDGSAPIISRDCANQRELEHEVNRLKGELDALLAAAGVHFGEKSHAASTKARKTAARRRSGTPVSGQKPHLRATLKVAETMTQNVKTVQRNDPLSAAQALMEDGNVRHVVVVDEAGKLAGIISHRDMFYSRLTRSMGQGKYAHENALGSITAKQIMQTEVITVDPETSLADAAALMMTEKVGCLPVLESDALVGILTETDFLSVLSTDAG